MGVLLNVFIGVDAIVHVASPLPGRAPVQHTLDVRFLPLLFFVVYV
jgi:hypothetical protein